MRSIGLIGGMSWESSLLYYQIINRQVGARLGGLHSAKIHLCSLDFEEIASRQAAGAWDELAAMLISAGRGLQQVGADCLLIGTNTMHCLAPQIQASVSIPVLHIADATAAAILRTGCQRVALLGTKYTMEKPFYVEHFRRHGIECVVPSEGERTQVHRIIFEELCMGDFRSESRAVLQGIAARLCARGAEGVVLACTELPLLLSQEHVRVPLFNTTHLHATCGVDFALGGS